MKTETRLDQLTSLRFFAALMIVIYHDIGVLGIGPAPVNLSQAVSFFFLLSGFILAHVYPSLDTGREVRRFWLARIARIWPAHLAALLIAFAANKFTWNPATGIPHLLLVQAWVPLSAFYFSYNAVAWSVSTEAFFYLAFPALIRNWQRTWRTKLAGAAIVLLVLIAAAAWAHLPDYGHAHNPQDSLKLSVHGLIYISPLARLFEFMAGMALANFWRGPRAASSRGTWLEVGVIALCAAAMYITPRFAEQLRSALGAGAVMWMTRSGSFVAFAALVHVMAQGGGAISRCLRWRPFVVLGEISFAMYLLHQSLYLVWAEHKAELATLPQPVAITLFFCILLGSSWLLWRLVETPARRAILNIGRPAARPAMTLSSLSPSSA